MRERLEILSSIPGIGMTTALMILVDMPETGGWTANKSQALLASHPLSCMLTRPAGQWMSQSSGKWQGKTRIQGGLPNLRHAIFMPARVAIRHNADRKARYNQLIAVGKEKKVAIKAIIRKLLVRTIALLRDQRKGAEYMA
jgi:transposase